MQDSPPGWRSLRAPQRPEASGFRELVATHALALAGDTLITLALAGSLFFSISPNAARGRVALSLLVTMAPFAVVAPLLGPAIDRSSAGRRFMIVGSCVGRAAVCIVMAIVVDSLLLFPAAFAVLVLSKAYSVAKSSLVPATVPEAAALVEANAKLAITGVLAGFLAAGPGILILQTLGPEWVLRVAAAVFVAGALSGLRLNKAPAPQREFVVAPPVLTPESGAIAPDSGVKSAVGETQRARLTATAGAMGLLRADVGFLTFLIAFGFRRADAPSWWFGVVLAMSMAGTLVGSIVAPRVRESLTEERMVLASLGLVGIAAVGFARLEGRLWSAGVAAAVGIAAGAGKLAFDSLVQQDAPDATRSRSFARFEAAFQLVWVLGALVPVALVMPVRLGLDAMGVGALASSVAYFFACRGWRPVNEVEFSVDEVDPGKP